MESRFNHDRSECFDQHREIKCEDIYSTGEHLNAALPQNFVFTSGGTPYENFTGNGFAPLVQPYAFDYLQHVFNGAKATKRRIRCERRVERRRRAELTNHQEARLRPSKQKKIKRRTNERKNNAPGTNANAVPIANGTRFSRRPEPNVEAELTAVPSTQSFGSLLGAPMAPNDLSHDQSAATPSANPMPSFGNVPVTSYRFRPAMSSADPALQSWRFDELYGDWEGHKALSFNEYGERGWVSTWTVE